MLELHFRSISETKPGKKWLRLFNTHWPAYKAWFQSKGADHKPDLATSQAALQQYMPEMVGLYEQLLELSGGDALAARFLTGYRPPAYITGCSQAVWLNQPQLVRNYDYHPHLSEGTLLHSAWSGKQVIATGDCLWGVVDGMNDDGLVASLTFGGRKVVGNGFGIPFILRYVLEFCSDVQEATEVLQRVPSHMAYNVMVLDKTGAYKMIQLAPDKKPVVTDAKVSTNHQGEVDWPEHAQFSQTLLREKHLKESLSRQGQDAEGLAGEFLQQPLFNTRYNDGFGTIYTAVYRPAEGRMELRWQEKYLEQSFADFEEGTTPVAYSEKIPAMQPLVTGQQYLQPDYAQATDADYWVEYGKAWASGTPTDLSKYVAKSLVEALGMAGYDNAEKLMEVFTSETKKRGQIPWEMLADVWANIGQSFQQPGMYKPTAQDEAEKGGI